MRVLYVSEDPSEAASLRPLLGEPIRVEHASPESLENTPEAAGDFETVVAGYLPPSWLAGAARLRHLVIPFAGVPQRTRVALSEHPQIAVYNSHYNSAFTAEHAWALLLASAKRLLPADRQFRENNWAHRYDGFPSFALRGGTLLLIGYGAIGQHLGRMGKAFGMRVWAVKRTPGEAIEVDGVFPREDLPRLLPEADAVILSLPETESTTGLLGEREFTLMKQGVLLVNVGRGSAVDEDAFFEAMRSGKIGAAGVDTWWVYPKGKDGIPNTPPSRHPLQSFENLILSPHRASDVIGSDEVQLRSVAVILRAILDGQPPRPVDRAEWY